MNSKPFKRTIATLLTLGGIALALAADDALAPAQGNPNITVPSSSTFVRGKPRSLYLIYTGTSASAGSTSGPSAQPLAAPAIPGYHPSDIKTAYGLPNIGGAGAIAIVDMNDLSSALTDFNIFSQTFGLPTEASADPLSSKNRVFQVVYAEGTRPPTDNTGWAARSRSTSSGRTQWRPRQRSIWLKAMAISRLRTKWQQRCRA